MKKWDVFHQPKLRQSLLLAKVIGGCWSASPPPPTNARAQRRFDPRLSLRLLYPLESFSPFRKHARAVSLLLRWENKFRKNHQDIWGGSEIGNQKAKRSPLHSKRFGELFMAIQSCLNISGTAIGALRCGMWSGPLSLVIRTPS